MISVLQIGEADGEVGFGHLHELQALEACFVKKAIPVTTYVVGAGRIDTENARRLAWNSNPAVCVWSVRRPLDTHLTTLFTHLRAAHVWITDQPGEPLQVRMTIIPAITSRPVQNWPGRVLQGLEYLPLDSSYADEPAPVEKREHDILMSLGGAAPSVATLRLLSAIAAFDSTVVVGPGFQHADQVQTAADRLRVRYVKAPDGLRELLGAHRIVVSAGGNTLAEAAA